MGAVRELIVRDLRATSDGRPASPRTLTMALELLELLWAELRQTSEEHERMSRALGAGAAPRGTAAK